MLHKNPIGSNRRQTVGIGLAFIFITLFIQQIASTVVGQEGDPLDVLIVANSGVPVNSVTVTALRNMFLKVQTTWGSGEKILPINPTDEQLRNNFRKKVLNMDTVAEQRQWEDLKIKFGQSEPLTFSNTLKAVFKLKGSISYVYRKDYKAGVVKVLLVIPSKEK